VVVSLTAAVPKTARKSIVQDAVRMKKRHIILLVEDNDDLRGMFRTALVVAGFHVQEAADGYDALRLLDEETPALVVLDLRLPLVDGREVLEEMRQQQKRVPVVIVTASDDELTGFDMKCVMRKPVTPEKLIATVMNCLSK
jgi:DNA-binding response OmpR family regulator